MGRRNEWGRGPDGDWESRWSQHRDGGRGGRGGWGGHGPGGPPPWAGLLGFGQGGGRGGPGAGRGPRVRRGDVRTAILDVLRSAAERGEQVNGYQVIQQIEERTGGAWKPSPGSVYPTVQQLQDEGLVVEVADGGRRALGLSEAGATYAAEHATELAAVWAPFEEPGEEPARGVDLKPEIGQVMSAVWQIVTTGSEQQRSAAVTVLVDARRKLYGILADGDEAEDGTAPGSADRD
ncbi:PadR family transcriptional regulator [Nocardioides pantholopis]|uniref:PadR family transcriptional regulator n=1 Tax=Nocardioides pantholopis TaxID=2483798 RepID=UPI000FDC6402|nr:PadR family transcriptional regulator [Nocardioides pantholopis]